ncbi:uncharacterized protein LOC118154608 [Callithrix jacchus]|uniref:collagen alpha-1(I) chain-like n=1 Tax=Callithrix jacchus TaxID=9483 RepID=UPI00159CF8A4|nr:collagen alpha-1(I) chain-like [Callithrix jacchus]
MARSYLHLNSSNETDMQAFQRGSSGTERGVRKRSRRSGCVGERLGATSSAGRLGPAGRVPRPEPGDFGGARGALGTRPDHASGPGAGRGSGRARPAVSQTDRGRRLTLTGRQPGPLGLEGKAGGDRGLKEQGKEGLHGPCGGSGGGVAAVPGERGSRGCSESREPPASRGGLAGG